MKRGTESLKRQILLHLKARPGQWINGGDFERMAMNAGFKASNADRRLRELCEEYREKPHGIRGQERPGPYASSMWYCYIPSAYELHHERMQAA